MEMTPATRAPPRAPSPERTMPKARTREEKLFGAACLKLTLVGHSGVASDIYEGALVDLGLTDAEVEAYLQRHRAEVEAQLAARRRGKSKH